LNEQLGNAVARFDFLRLIRNVPEDHPDLASITRIHDAAHAFQPAFAHGRTVPDQTHITRLDRHRQPRFEVLAFARLNHVIFDRDQIQARVVCVRACRDRGRFM
jgi:hypothetical protein